jgi:hypothetical protein
MDEKKTTAIATITNSEISISIAFSIPSQMAHA